MRESVIIAGNVLTSEVAEVWGQMSCDFFMSSCFFANEAKQVEIEKMEHSGKWVLQRADSDLPYTCVFSCAVCLYGHAV